MAQPAQRPAHAGKNRETNCESNAEYLRVPRDGPFGHALRELFLQIDSGGKYGCSRSLRHNGSTVSAASWSKPTGFDLWPSASTATPRSRRVTRPGGQGCCGCDEHQSRPARASISAKPSRNCAPHSLNFWLFSDGHVT